MKKAASVSRKAALSMAFDARSVEILGQIASQDVI